MLNVARSFFWSEISWILLEHILYQGRRIQFWSPFQAVGQLYKKFDQEYKNTVYILGNIWEHVAKPICLRNYSQTHVCANLSSKWVKR